MTMSKWVATLGAMVVAVFGITFVLNYTGSAPDKTESTDDSTSDLPVLEFKFKKFPLTYANLPVGSIELEHRKPGFQDYLFTNPNDTKVRIGGVSKSCKCQGVEVYVLPEGRRAQVPLLSPLPVVAAKVGLLGRAALQYFVDEFNAKLTAEQEALAEKSVVLNPDDPNADATIPPHRDGWVRMKWTGEKAGKMNLTATLWLDHPGSSIEVTLERMVDFVDPVLIIDSDSKPAIVQMEELPRTFYIYVWSSTRKSFNITKKEILRDARLPAESDAFTIGEPVALTNAQCAAAASMFRSTQVLSAYQVPVTLQKNASDGTPIDIGSFRRRIELSTDASDKVLSFTLAGIVRGDVHITNADEAGGVTFGSFRRDNIPAPRYVFIHCDVPNVNLELDEKRVPEYLQAKLTKETETDRNTWKLEIRVLPGVFGRFPRDDDPAYRDSAIYLRTVGPKRQNIRVTVRGDAGSG